MPRPLAHGLPLLIYTKRHYMEAGVQQHWLSRTNCLVSCDSEFGIYVLSTAGVMGAKWWCLLHGLRVSSYACFSVMPGGT